MKDLLFKLYYWKVIVRNFSIAIKILNILWLQKTLCFV